MIVTTRNGTTDETEPRLIHTRCRDNGNGNGPALLPAYQPTGVA